MIQSTNLLQNNIQDFFIRNTSYQKSFSPNNKNLLNAKNDNLSLSNESKSLQSLDSKPIDQLIYERKTSIDFQYSFTNSFIQVQSKGNYNIHQQSGFLNMNISFVQRVEKDDDKLTLYPFKVNVSLNFSMYDEQVNNKSGKKIIKPDIKKVVQKILNEIFDLTKDGQNKSIILEFENNDTLKELCKLEEGKVLKMLYNYLAIIAQMNNPFDKDGKRDIVKLLVKDQTKEFDYEQRDLSINITNIDLKFSFDYEEFKEIFLSNAEELVNI
jgi:hypothetical protein